MIKERCIMKKILSVIFILVIILSLSSCGSDSEVDKAHGDNDQSSEQIVDASEEPSENESDGESSESVNVNPDTESIDSNSSAVNPICTNYKQIVTDLGYLLNDSRTWSSVDELSSSDFIMWYAVYLQNKHGDDEFYLSRYLIDGQDGFHFPASELETVVTSYFDVPVDKLKNDILYNSQTDTYATSSAIGPMAEIDIVVNNADIVDGNVVIDFTLMNLSNGTESDHRLTVADTPATTYLAFE